MSPYIAPPVFWDTPEFAEFLPYIYAKPAMDKRQGKSPRLDMKSSTPYAIKQKALAWTAPCCNCGRPIHPFRDRAAQAKRGFKVQGIYFAVACGNDYRNGACSRGNRASAAYQAIWALIRGLPDQGQQVVLL